MSYTFYTMANYFSWLYSTCLKWSQYPEKERFHGKIFYIEGNYKIKAAHGIKVNPNT